MFARGRSDEDRSYSDGELRVKKVWIFKFWLQKLSNLRTKDFISISKVASSCPLISKFDPKPIATLSEPSFKPSYVEPSEPPKLP
jgi:hypothetical protein